MRQSTTKPKRVRGYQIHVFRGAQYQPASFTTPLMWRERVPLAEWEQVISDPATQQAWIIQSGRKMREFQFRRDQPAAVPLTDEERRHYAPLNGNREFRLLK